MSYNAKNYMAQGGDMKPAKTASKSAAISAMQAKFDEEVAKL